MPVRGKQWRTPGVWRLLWTEQRISLTFDALAYAEIRSTQADAGDLPTFQVVARRVARNFAAAAASLTRTNGIVNRATVSALGQGTAEKGDPAKVVAALHLNDGLKAIAARGEATDLSVAVNRRARWVLDGEAVEVNRHEALSSTWTIGAGESGKVLVAQVEVNTIPERQLANTPLSEAQLAGFFEQASTWVDERWKAIEAEACRV
jgi:hypothetical protein